MPMAAPSATSIGKAKGGHYRVRIEGEWVDVPDEAVITEPNRVGRTMVWPIKRLSGTEHPLLHAGQHDVALRTESTQRLVRRAASGVFLVALQQLDRNALRPADEADAHAGPDGGRLAW